MTVKELISRLKEFDEDLEVNFCGREGATLENFEVEDKLYWDYDKMGESEDVIYKKVLDIW